MRLGLLVAAGLIGAKPLQAQAGAEYLGGTAAALRAGQRGSMELADERFLAFYAGKQQVRVKYSDINLLEYGLQVDRRLALSILISPVFLLSKARKHFLTIGYTDDRGIQQALVFRIDKRDIRPALVGLEARTGLTIEFQDSEARKAGGF